MSLDKVTLNFNENGQGAHIRIEIDLLKHTVSITNMAEPFITTTITKQQAHDISHALLVRGL